MGLMLSIRLQYRCLSDGCCQETPPLLSSNCSSLTWRASFPPHTSFIDLVFRYRCYPNEPSWRLWTPLWAFGWSFCQLFSRKSPFSESLSPALSQTNTKMKFYVINYNLLINYINILCHVNLLTGLFGGLLSWLRSHCVDVSAWPPFQKSLLWNLYLSVYYT